jgi:hypothetical protein
MKHLHHLIAAAAALCAMQAHAYTATLTAGDSSLQAGVTTETFQAGAVFARTGGGTVYNSDSPDAGLTGDNIYLIYTVSAQPKKAAVSANDKWFSVGGADAPAVFHFSPATTYVGFLWGSVDTYNQVSFFDGSSNLIASFVGGAHGLANNEVANGFGSQGQAQYFNFSAPSIGSVRFTSGGNAFEIDNLSAVAAVPEPDTYALMLGGLAAVGFVARRRRSA